LWLTIQAPTKKKTKEEEKEEEEEEEEEAPKMTGEGYLVFLNPEKAKPCPLISKEEISWDTRRLRFG